MTNNYPEYYYCIYDNPITCRREQWVDGKVHGFVNVSLIEQVRKSKYYPNNVASWVFNIPFTPGRLCGNSKALSEKELKNYEKKT